jgi:hypothetical protein
VGGKLLVSGAWSYRKAAGGIPESAREPSPVYPAGRVGTPADSNNPRAGEPSLDACSSNLMHVTALHLIWEGVSGLHGGGKASESDAWVGGIRHTHDGEVAEHAVGVATVFEGECLRRGAIEKHVGGGMREAAPIELHLVDGGEARCALRQLPPRNAELRNAELKIIFRLEVGMLRCAPPRALRRVSAG